MGGYQQDPNNPSKLIPNSGSAFYQVGNLTFNTGSFVQDDATPSVEGGNVFYTTPGSSGAVTITQLDDGSPGQQVTIVGKSGSNKSTINNGGNFNLVSTTAMTFDTDDTLTLTTLDGTNWVEIARSNN